jgi:transposase
MLAVTVGQREVAEQEWKQATFGTTWRELMRLREWLKQQGVEQVGMESTAQYWRPVWMELEEGFAVHLAQARSNRAPGGRKTDQGDAQRLVRRYLSGDLVLSFVPEPPQRSWRMLSRGRAQLAVERVRLQNQIENLLEETQIKRSSVVSDLLGASGRRILEALSRGETQPERLVELADYRLRISREDLTDALKGHCPVAYQRMLKRFLERLATLEKQMEEISQELSEELRSHPEAVTRLAEIPGLGAEAAQQIIAEAGTSAQAFASAAQFASWIGVCPGRKESAGKSRSDRSPQGNRTLRRVLTQVAWAAVRTKGSRFQALFQRLVVRLGAQKAIWAIAHRLARLVWLVLHQGQAYRELGPLALDPKAILRRKQNLVKQLRALGFEVQLQLASPA